MTKAGPGGDRAFVMYGQTGPGDQHCTAATGYCSIDALPGSCRPPRIPVQSTSDIDTNRAEHARTLFRNPSKNQRVGIPAHRRTNRTVRTVTAIGYARVSTRDQNPALQHDALTKAGCARVFTDTASGAKADRPQLAGALDYLRPGDVLTVWQLDRLGRNMRHLIDTVNALHERGVQFRSLRENVDTTTASGKLTFHLFAALAEFERDLLRERTTVGLVLQPDVVAYGGSSRLR
jgi:hypothetical protein